MDTKDAIVANWLPRYTGTAASEIEPCVLLTNFSGYLETFSGLTIGIEALRLIRREGRSVRHLRFDE